VENPDREEKIIRFGCGSLFGLVVAFWTLCNHAGPIWTMWIAVIAGAMLLFGYLAMKWGDKFWQIAFNNWWWWI
jgi:hypothetical protein